MSCALWRKSSTDAAARRAGAVPGPVAYNKGGTLPTVTDANVVLGYLPEDLLGGSFKLDREGVNIQPAPPETRPAPAPR